jgi:hypothetical protein
MEIGRRVRHLRAVRAQQKHWHGASPTTAMSHIAIQESLDGKPVEWLEKVTDQQYQSKAEKMNPSLPARRTLRTAASLLACLTMGGTLVACSSSPPSDTAIDAHTGQDASSCSLDGSFHVTFAPVAGSPAACSCGECSYDVAGGHITDSMTLADSNVQYFLQPTFAPTATLPTSYDCNSTETPACTFEGDCLGSFKFTVTNGGASGTQTYAFNTVAPDGGAHVTCTYDVTASPCAPVGTAVCKF